MTVDFCVRDFGKVAVLMGGTSAEREVSLITGQNVLAGLQRSGVDAHGLDVGYDLIYRLSMMRPDRAFIALHGPGGEDGIIQGVLEHMQIPYTGSGVAASALTMDKPRTKWVWQSNGLPTPPFIVTDNLANAEALIKEFGLPLCVKPVDEGSSLGITKVSAKEQLVAAYEKVKAYDSDFMIEPWMEGAEYTIGILGDKALPIIEIQTPRVFYDYEAKYLEESTRYICPCNLALDLEQKWQKIAMEAFKAVGCEHWGRVDAVTDRQGNFWLLEINTIPGMTDHSLVPKAANVLGISFDDLVLEILSYTL
jgi:D-alanine-D-alanine ligase